MPKIATVSRTDADLALLDSARRLRTGERAILEFLLHEPFPGRDQLRGQLESALVDSECADGCRTIGILVDRSTEPTPRDAVPVPVEAEGLDADGMPIVVVLHAPDGYLRELEIVRFDGEAPRTMPPASSLRRRINVPPDDQS